MLIIFANDKIIENLNIKLAIKFNKHFMRRQDFFSYEAEL